MSEVLTEISGAVGHLILNRPKAINALTLGMVEDVAAALTRFAADPDIALVLLTGEGERGLCAGGDIRALYEHGRDKRGQDTGAGEIFFRAEYRMNAQIAAFPKPYVAVMDGITMGGGVGISAHGTIRIVTERTKLAMPETGIGFFPDVGASWLLSRAPGEFGTFMALTGEAVSGGDAIHAGLADYFVQSEKLPGLIAALKALPASATLAEARALVSGFGEAGPAPLAALQTQIDALFAFDDVEEIIAALEGAGTTFAADALRVMRQRSPTSMKVALRMLRLAKHDVKLEQSLEREFAGSFAVLASDEFYEGVRAAVVDKDRNPHWRPATLAEVSGVMVDHYFSQHPSALF